MINIWAAILVSVISFLATNQENLFILLAYFHHPQYSFRAISMGYVAITGLILLTSYGFSQIAQVMPSFSIHYLGFLPIILGTWELLKLLRKSQNYQSEAAVPSGMINSFNGAINVGIATLASSGDSLVVYTSLFADTQYSADSIILFTGIGISMLWVTFAGRLSRHPWISAQLHRWGDYLLPFFLIAVGLFILMDTPVDVD